MNNGEPWASLDRMPPPLHKRIVNYAVPFALVVCIFGTALAHAQEAIPIPHLSPIDHGELEQMAEDSRSALYRVRSVSTPDGLFQPIPLEGEGLAVWLTIGENEPALVTTYGYVSAAQTVEVLIAGEWVDAEVVYGSPLFDLAMLDIEPELSPNDAIALVERWPMEAIVYVPLGTADSTAPAEVVQGMLGGRGLPDMLSYYIRAHLWQRNGYPIMSRAGEVMAIASIFAPDGDGILAIPFQQIATWRSEWENLDPDDLYNHRPTIRIERIEPVIEGGVPAEAGDTDGGERVLPRGAIRGRFENTGAPP